MLNKTQIKRLHALRQRLFVCINFENKMSEGHHKSYEGELEIGYRFPGVFGDDILLPCCIHLSCYLLCDSREEEFFGATFKDCLDKLEKFIEGCEKGQAEIRERGII